MPDAATPWDVIYELEHHYERLQKLCLEFISMEDDPCPEDERITTLKDFVNLEDLQIDAWSLDHEPDDIDEVGADNSNETGDDDGQQTAKISAIRALPASLKRLCVKGDSVNIEQSMHWLMMNVKDSLPHLKELEFSRAIRVTSQATEAVVDLGVELRYCD